MSDQLQFDFEGRDRNQDRAGDADPELPRDPFVNGYDDFGAEQAAAVRAMEDRFGVILNKNVRLKLIGWDEVFEGRLMLKQLLYPATRQEGLRLRIGTVDFDYTDIEYCFRKEE